MHFKHSFGLLAILCVMAAATATAQDSPVGVWKTMDDKTGKAKSHVEIYEKNGKFHGKIVKLLQKAPDTVCEKCTGDKKDKPLVGMVIVSNLKPEKGSWRGGNILDPENGNEYGCSVWFEKDNTDELHVRGKHWSGIFRTQKWYRIK